MILNWFRVVHRSALQCGAHTKEAGSGAEEKIKEIMFNKHNLPCLATSQFTRQRMPTFLVRAEAGRPGCAGREMTGRVGMIRTEFGPNY